MGVLPPVNVVTPYCSFYGELPALHISLMCSLVLVFLKRRHRRAILQGYHGKTAPTKFSDVLTSTTNGSEGSGLWHMGALVKCSLGLGKLEWLPATSRESWVFFLRVIFLFKRGHYFAKTSNEPTIKKITNLRYLFSDYVDLGLVHFYTSFINPEILLHTFPDSPTDCYMTLVYCLYLMDIRWSLECCQCTWWHSGSWTLLRARSQMIGIQIEH